jgi:hypothetical protein
MVLAPYSGMMLPPGMGSPVYSTDHDIMGMIYGSPHLCLFATHCVVSGAARDAGNTADTTVLRSGLIMAKITATQKWIQFTSGASDGSEIPLGILCVLGLNTQMDGANQDRFLATIMVKGNVNPEALCIGSTAAYGLDKATAAHVAVRKALALNFMFSDDFQNVTGVPIANR